MSNAAWAFGSTLAWGANPIVELTNIGTPNIAVDTIDVTSHGSTSGFREFLAGLADGGEIAIEGNFYSGDTNGQVAMMADLVARTNRVAVVTFPAAVAATWTATGFLTAYQAGPAGIDGAVPFTATIKITGVPAMAVTASTGASALSAKSQADAALTLNPAFAIGTFDYVIDVANTVTGIKWTVTAATHTITITDGYTGLNTDATSAVETGALAMGAAASINIFTIKVQQSGKVAKTYTVRVNKAA
jgi:predicted secreted protein